ncbi:MAG: NifU family protein [Candidatus Thermoplasmatota archaeon]|nr:NifU family protein [Candidatus Thermoplasmatota archaeon]
MSEIDRQTILDSVGPVQTILDAHDGVVNVIDTTGGVISISLEGGCTGCSSTPMTAMQIYYSLMKLDEVNDVLFVNGELPAYMRSFINEKLGIEG